MADWQDGEGVSDSGAALYLPFILDTVSPKTLIVERPKHEVMASMKRYAAGLVLDWEAIDAYLDEALRKLGIDHPLIKRVAYGDLGSLETVVEALDWLECERPRNLAQLQHLVVNSALAYNMSLLSAKAA